MRTSFIIIGFLFVLYPLSVLFLYKIKLKNAGIFLLLSFGLIYLITGLINKGYIITIILSLLLFIVMSYGFILIYSSCKIQSKDAYTVIVLGCRVKNGKPSLMLQSRLDSAHNYLLKNKNSVCILTGGKGDDEIVSEAECSFNYLKKNGIDSTRLYIENKSVNTDDNFKFSEKIIIENKLSKNVAIVTSEYHQYRAKLLAKKYNLNYSAIVAHTKPYVLPIFFVRECIAILFYKFKLIIGEL